LAENQSGARRRKRRKTTVQGSSRGRALLSLAARIPVTAAERVWGFVSKKTKLSFAFVAVAIAVWTTSFTVSALEARARSALPKHVVVHASSQTLREAVLKTAKATLARARQGKETRVVFLAQLSETLSKMEAIDTFSLRAGLDERLQITLVTQVPLFVLEGQGKERVLVGHKMRVLQRKLGATEHTNLLRIVTPELRISQVFPKPQAGANATPPLNFAWLAAQGARIQAAAQAQSETFVLDEIAWTSSLGFTLGIRLPLEASPEVRVHLGESDLPKKLAKLPETLESLKERGLTPTNIDLDFGDKALIRLSESAAPVAPL
jgi:hypothetical protein